MRSGDLFRPAIADLVPYEPGKPVEEVQRELGLERVVKLASNEGQFGPFPAAIEALERAIRDCNRYPDGGAYRLTVALAEKHGVERGERRARRRRRRRDHVPLARRRSTRATRSSAAGRPSRATSSTRSSSARRRCAFRSRTTPTTSRRSSRRSPRGRRSSSSRTRTTRPGRWSAAPSSTTYFARVPDHVLTVLDEAYFEYVDEADYPDGIEEYLKRDGRRVLVPADVLEDLRARRAARRLRHRAGRRRRGDPQGAQRVRHQRSRHRTPRSRASATTTSSRRRREVTARGPRAARRRSAPGSRSASRPPTGGELRLRGHRRATSAPLFDALLREGVIVRPLAPFGAPTAIRVTVGTAEENDLFGEALSPRRSRSCPARDSRGAGGTGARLRLLRTGARLPASLFLAALASGIGTWLAFVALVVDVTERTEDARWVSALLVAEFLPVVVVGLLAGPLVDRLPRRRILVAPTSRGRSSSCSCPSRRACSRSCGLAFAAGVATSLFRPALYAGLPNLVSDERPPAGERAPADGRQPDLGGRRARRAARSSPFPARTRRTSINARQLRRLGAPPPPHPRESLEEAARRRAAATCATWPTGSAARRPRRGRFSPS